MHGMAQAGVPPRPGAIIYEDDDQIVAVPGVPDQARLAAH